jgi:hypothetical protein
MHSGNINNLSYYYFSRSTKNSLFSEQNIVGQNRTEKFTSNSIQIDQIMLKLLLEKNKNENFNFFYFGSKAHLMHAARAHTRCAGTGAASSGRPISEHAAACTSCPRTRP